MSSDPERAAEYFGPEDGAKITNLLNRKNLPTDDRIVCMIACLQALVDKPNLIKILKYYTIDEESLRRSYETLLQGYLFCGYPSAIESFFCLNEALSEKTGLSPGDYKARRLADHAALTARGEELARKVHGDKMEKIRNKIGDFCPDLGYLMIAEGYGHVLSRDGLGLRTRELAVVSSLTALGAERQLYSHIRGARNVGCGDSEIYEAILSDSIWVPEEKIKSAFDLWSGITGNSQSEFLGK